MSVLDWHVYSLYIFSWTFPAFLCYLTSVSVCVVQMVRILLNRHRPSWQFAFLFLCALWAVLRICFLIFGGKIASVGEKHHSMIVLFVLLFDSPYVIQYSTFALLALFYASSVHRRSWHAVSWFFWLFYALFVVLLLAILVSYTAIMGEFGTFEELQTPSRSWRRMYHQAAFSLVSICVVTVLAVYGVLFAVRLNSDVQLQILLFLGSGKRTKLVMRYGLIVVTIIVWFSFLTRAGYDIITMIWPESTTLHVNNSGSSATSWQSFLFFLFMIWWEIVPAVVVIVLFFKIPSLSGTRKREREVFNFQRKPLLSKDKGGDDGKEGKDKDSEEGPKNKHERNPKRSKLAHSYDSGDSHSDSIQMRSSSLPIVGSSRRDEEPGSLAYDNASLFGHTILHTGQLYEQGDDNAAYPKSGSNYGGAGMRLGPNSPFAPYATSNPNSAGSAGGKWVPPRPTGNRKLGMLERDSTAVQDFRYLANNAENIQGDEDGGVASSPSDEI